MGVIQSKAESTLHVALPEAAADSIVAYLACQDVVQGSWSCRAVIILARAWELLSSFIPTGPNPLLSLAVTDLYQG